MINIGIIVLISLVKRLLVDDAKVVLIDVNRYSIGQGIYHVFLDEIYPRMKSFVWAMVDFPGSHFLMVAGYL